MANEIEIIRPNDHVAGYTLGPVTAADASIEALPVWKRTAVVNHTRGLLYLSAAFCLLDEQVGASMAEKDGEHVVLWREHYYVPAGWIVKKCRNEQRDRVRAMFRRIYKDFFPHAIEVPEHVSYLGLKAEGSL